MKKKIFLSVVSLVCLLLLIGCSEVSSDESNEKVVRIGYQKNGPLIILKSLGTLEERLEEIGYKVEWHEFQAGPALVEALNAESIDFGRAGNTPPIFAQAASAPFVYAAVGNSKYEGSGILVSQDSDIQTVADLKGKTVSFAKGSSSHYLIVKALQEAGLKYEDITPAFLSPGDARIAFEQGNVDAMVVWDPFTASTEINSNGRMLLNGEGLTTDRDFFIATNHFAEEHQDIMDIIIEEIAASSEWANKNHDDLVKMLAPILNLDEESIRMSVERRIYGIGEITEEIIAEQQDIADLFYELAIIPKEIDVSEVMMK
ncbi:sulfonate ABC transporter substrate-binding protein [Oceanobacillus bengalensis]|uniref:Putative aliphatic sulfonates-binding protein n=1 Tax=Oceanobacillus bengalensis TaxID=1435466 RepID=A0A494YX00_9BACI|nr:sulfonate ABC transporter substrate-binding protein [Oceanobacillus bengalensis]RKQ14543.1 sulfonate ABC transporter substrate-binding protein [Oceanobacillus bengalensis]